MDNFKTSRLTFSPDDDGIAVKDLLQLVEGNPLSEKLFVSLNVEAIKDEFIAIPGAKKLVDYQMHLNRQFNKVDLVSNLDKISFYDQQDEFSINFHGVASNEYFQSFGLDFIESYPVYSARSDFFSGLHDMTKYASSLIQNGRKDILQMNLEMLKSDKFSPRKYRILHDLTDGLFYLRAIVSVGRYNDYDNSMAIVLALISLHRQMKSTVLKYRLKSCELNESFIDMYFESSEVKSLKTIGSVTNIVEVSNDEIKRESLRFNAVCSINYKTKEGKDQELFVINPKSTKTTLLSIKHNVKPDNAIKELSTLGAPDKDQKYVEMFEDISTIVGIKEPEQIKYLLQKKVEKAKSELIKPHRKQILKALEEPTKNVIQLLTVFNKIELLVGNDIDAVDYIRFTIYEALIDRH